MNKKNEFRQTRTLTLLGLMTAIILILAVVPGLGFVPVGPINATTLHIPVIILAIVEGPVAGGVLGFIFGVISMIRAILQPTPMSFIFMNPIVAIIPRVLIGLLTGYVYQVLKRKKTIGKLSIGIASGIGSLVNTVFVMGLIYLIYGQKYLDLSNELAAAKAASEGVEFIANTSVIKLIGGIILTQGLAEMLVAILIATPICFALLRGIKKRKKA